MDPQDRTRVKSSGAVSLSPRRIAEDVGVSPTQSRAMSYTMRAIRAAAIGLCFVLQFAENAQSQSRTYTTNADFAEGALINVNFDAPNADQLQLNDVAETSPLPFLNVPATLRGTLVRIDVNSGAVIGEYRTAPNGELRGPSRTSVDSQGNVWIANRDFTTGNLGAVCKIGVVIGGTRVDSTGTPDPMGEYLAPPYLYNTCVDRDGDGLIRTSRGLGNILDWPNVNDTGMGADGLVQDAVDECIQIYKLVSGTAAKKGGAISAGSEAKRSTVFIDNENTASRLLSRVV